MASPRAAAASTRDPEEGIAGAWRWRGGWQRWLFPAVWLIYLGQTLGGIGDHSSGAGTVVGIVVLVTFAVGYLVALPIGVKGQRRTWVAIIALSCLVAIEAAFAH